LGLGIHASLWRFRASPDSVLGQNSANSQTRPPTGDLQFRGLNPRHTHRSRRQAAVRTPPICPRSLEQGPSSAPECGQSSRQRQPRGETGIRAGGLNSTVPSSIGDPLPPRGSMLLRGQLPFDDSPHGRCGHSPQESILTADDDFREVGKGFGHNSQPDVIQEFLADGSWRLR